MFLKTRLMLFICGLLILAVTICGIFFFTDASQRTLRFWILAGGILFAEASFILSGVDTGGNHSDKGYLYRLLNPIMSLIYMLFTGLMLTALNSGVSTNGLLFIEIAALVVFVIAIMLINMGAATTDQPSSIHQNVRNITRHWLSKLLPFQNDAKLLCDRKLYGNFTELLEAIRYSPVGINADTENTDKAISSKLDILTEYIQNKDIVSISKTIPEIMRLLQRRSQSVKIATRR